MLEVIRIALMQRLMLKRQLRDGEEFCCVIPLIQRSSIDGYFVRMDCLCYFINSTVNFNKGCISINVISIDVISIDETPLFWCYKDGLGMDSFTGFFQGL